MSTHLLTLLNILNLLVLVLDDSNLLDDDDVLDDDNLLDDDNILLELLLNADVLQTPELVLSSWQKL